VLPFFRKLWFWLIVLAVLAVGFIALLLYVPLTPEPEDETANQLPVVVGAPEGTSYKDLPPNTTIDANNLLVTVTDVTGGLIASDGKPIIAVEIQFFNKGDHAITVYSTQWMMEDATGARVDCFIGKTDTGETIATLETSDLAVGAQRTTTFYFSGEDLTRVLFLPDALSYEENDLVSWFVPPASDEEESN
jgi:hypothetical protein